MIYGLAGKPRAGKDTVASLLVRNFGFTRISFGDTLKDFVATACEIDVNMFHDEKLKDDFFTFTLEPEHIENMINLLNNNYVIDEPTKDNLMQYAYFRPKTPRELLQLIGSDMFRDYVDSEIWIKLTTDKIMSTPGNIVISDARFPNERTAIEELGGKNILVLRPGFDTVGSTHAAENSLGEPEDYDFVFLNNSSLVAFENEINLWYTLRPRRC